VEGLKLCKVFREGTRLSGANHTIKQHGLTCACIKCIVLYIHKNNAGCLFSLIAESNAWSAAMFGVHPAGIRMGPTAATQRADTWHSTTKFWVARGS
jgi:hypothetical protein